MLSAFDERHPDSYHSFELFAFDARTGAIVGCRMTEHPVKHVADAAFSVVVDGRQRSLHASRRLPADDVALQVGPVAITGDVHSIGMSAEAPELGVSASITGVTPHRTLAPVLWHDTDLRVSLDGSEVVPRAARRCRRRDVGGVWVTPPGTYGAPALELPQFFRWSVDIDGPLGSLDGDGSPTALTPRWAPGTRRCDGGSLHLDGVEHGFVTRAHLPMRGLGVDDRDWPAGRWHDELAIGAQSWQLDALDPTDVHNLRTIHAIEMDDGTFGFLDLVAVGPSEAHGLTRFSDGYADPG